MQCTLWLRVTPGWTLSRAQLSASTRSKTAGWWSPDSSEREETEFHHLNVAHKTGSNQLQRNRTEKIWQIHKSMLSSRVNIKEVSLRITGGRFQCFVSSLQTSQNPADGFSTLCEALLTGNDRMVHSEIIFSFIKWFKLCLQSKMSTSRKKRCLQSVRLVKLSRDLHVTNTNRPQDDEITVFYLNATRHKCFTTSFSGAFVQPNYTLCSMAF